MFIYGCLDLHPNNIGVALPELEAFSEIMIWEQAPAPYVVPLVVRDPAHDLASFPPYLCATLDIGNLLLEGVQDAPRFAASPSPRVRIFDFESGARPVQSV
jgi:hypothetical protein